MSGRIVDYSIVFGENPMDLDMEVRGKLGEGWKLYGTPFANGPFFCQAMVKEIPAHAKEIRR